MQTRAEPPKARSRFAGLLTAAVVAILYLAAVEVGLRFLPVATGLRSVAVSEAQPIFHYQPDRSFVYSTGWRMRHVNHGRINNAGWVNDRDYGRDGKLPLVAIIGDSYIEAETVPYADTVQGRLAAALEGRFRVYSIAASGAPLSEFLVYARYAVREFGARAVVFNIANYDFAGSDIRYGQPLGMWVYDDEGSDRKLRLIPYHPSGLRSAVRHSALLRYLVLNLRLGRQVAAAQLAGLAPIGTAYANAATTDTQASRHTAAAKVIGDFFRDLPRFVDLPAERVLFLMDGVRYPELTFGDNEGLRRDFRVAAEERGHEAIDLDKLFFARHRQDGTRFEMPGDRHWNPAGHAVAAAGVLSSRLLHSLEAAEAR